MTSTEDRVRRRFLTDGSDPALPAAARLRRLLEQEDPLLCAAELERRARDLEVDLVGLGPLQRLLDLPDVTDVLVNGPGEVWVERDGRLARSDVSVDADTIRRCIERLVAPLGLRSDRSSPVTDARLPDGTRVTVVREPLAVHGPLLALRRHRVRAVELGSFAGPRVAGLLRDLVAERRNIVVYGATGAGKTTLVNALVALVDPSQRIVTIEDVAELQLPGDHVVGLEARPGTSGGAGLVTIRELVRTALRLRPDRLVVGEVRGAEALDMLWAMSTGHSGSFSTCHARSAEGAIRRLEILAMSSDERLPAEVVTAQVADAVDVVVGVRRTAAGARVVDAVHAVDDRGRVYPLFEAPA